MTRIYSNFHDAKNEIRRDLSELAVQLPASTWQGKDVHLDSGFNVHELQNYVYTVTQPDLEELNPTQPWADHEFIERVAGFSINPGKAWQLRPEVWTDLLEPTGRFSYSYSERLGYQIKKLILAFKRNPISRQLYLGIWDPDIDHDRYDERRVPCSLGYYFQYRGDKLNMTYLQRSCDFSTHYENDIYLACRMMRHIAANSDVESGHFSHWIGSLHVFAKDVEGTF